MAVYPLNHGRILYENKATRANTTFTGDAPSTAHPWELVLDPETNTYYEPPNDTLTPALQLKFTSPITASHIGLNGMSERTQSYYAWISPSGNFDDLIQVGNILVDDPSCMLYEFEEQEILGVRYQMFRDNYDDPMFISNIYVGTALEMERPHYAGVNPPSIAVRNKIEPMGSASGHFLGRRILKKGVTMNAEYRHLTTPWMSQQFARFVESSVEKPFFYAWNLLEHPRGTIYGQTAKDVSVSMMGIGDFMQTSFTIEGQK